jgi:hypothetical protein
MKKKEEKKKIYIPSIPLEKCVMRKFIRDAVTMRVEACGLLAILVSSVSCVLARSTRFGDVVRVREASGTYQFH